MKKSAQERLNASLDKALAPPRQKPKQNLDALLDEYDDQVTRPAPTSTTSTTTPTSTTLNIAPMRDFAKVANSIAREAVPAGLFTGKSKQIYDFLYSKTRGAIVPKTSERIKFKDLMRGAHIGSEVTLRLNLDRLQAVGLIAYQRIPGEHEGNEYTVYLPEEAGGDTSSTSTTTSTSSSQNLVVLVGVESSTTSTTLNPTDSATSTEPKTSFKTSEQNTDDEAFALLVELLKQATTNLTGKSPTTTERERWREFGELIVAELQIAAARTGQVSNVPAFLTEHLRRRLWKKDKAQLDREEKTAPEMQPKIDASKCPDCGGAGWWYPDGLEKGVAKCRHVRLTPATE